MNTFRPGLILALAALFFIHPRARAQSVEIGQEVALRKHLADGEEFKLPLRGLIKVGKEIFSAVWTEQEGGGRPLTKGTGSPLSDPTSPLVFPDNFNRVSAPDANSCAGCHNAPFGIPGGGGDFVTNVFVLGQRFDFATFDPSDTVPTRGGVDENGSPVTLPREHFDVTGTKHPERRSRIPDRLQMTEDLQRIRNATLPGTSNPLETKGISFGTIKRNVDGSWNVSAVEGLPAVSLATSGAVPPSLIIRPFHQAGSVVSIREFTNNAMNHHHGIQPIERFGSNTDPDGDGFVNELSVGDGPATPRAHRRATRRVSCFGCWQPVHPLPTAHLLLSACCRCTARLSCTCAFPRP